MKKAVLLLFLFLVLMALPMWGQFDGCAPGDWAPCDPTSCFAQITYNRSCTGVFCQTPGYVLVDVEWVWTDTYYGTTCDSGQYFDCEQFCPAALRLPKKPKGPAQIILAKAHKAPRGGKGQRA